MDAPDRGRSKSRRQPQREHSRYDQALGAAKNGGKLVTFTMVQEADFVDEDCNVTGHVIQIDKFNIEIAVPNTFGTLWLSKSSIMATRVLR